MRFLVAGLVACAPSPPDALSDEEALAAVQAPGQHPVGHARFTVETVQLGTDAPRSLPVDIWYPAREAGSRSTVYGIAGLVQVPSPLATEEPAPVEGPLPVAVYSHGSGGVAAVGYDYGELLASHGWIVVAPDHVGNTALDILGGGLSYVQSAIDRPLDVAAVLDALEAGIDLPIEPQTDDVLLIGHSFGGFTSFVAAGVSVDLDGLGRFCPANSDDPDCLLLEDPEVLQAVDDGRFADARIAAIVPQAPAAFAFAEGSVAALDQPVLMMSGGRDRTTPNRDNAGLAWDELDGPEDRWLRLPDGGHYSFISLCEHIDPAAFSILLDVENDGCGSDFVPIDEVVPALASYALAWGAWHVGEEEVYRAVFDAEPLHAGFRLQTR